MKRVSVWMACAAAALLAVPAMAGEDVESQLAEMQKLVKGLQQKVNAQSEQLDHQSKQLQDAQRVVRADEQGSLSGLAAFLDSIDVDGGAAASYNHNWNDVSDTFIGTSDNNTGFSGLFLPFHRDSDTFQVDQVWIGIGKPATAESRGGFRFDIFYGATASNYAAATGDRRDNLDSTADYAIDQAYVQYMAPVADIDFKMGKFATPVGAEVARQWNNFNMTRGLVYTMMQPVNHLGLIATVPLGDMASIGAGLVNSGGSTISAPDDTKEKSYLGTVYVGDSRANLRTSFIYGFDPSFPGSITGQNVGEKTGLVDVTGWFNPTENVSLWANYDYLYVENTGYYTHGIAVAGRVGMGDAGVALRGEYVQEHQTVVPGPTIGLLQGFSETAKAFTVTLTGDYALTDHLKVKLEGRYDRVNEGDFCCQFDEGEDGIQDRDQLTSLIGAEYTF
jgi:hypothetical protein